MTITCMLRAQVTAISQKGEPKSMVPPFHIRLSAPFPLLHSL
ncbi:hypothetical protein CLOSYM_03015 [[Clostridium] symbiosum ATCC 14940]|uniref:Uncharacterized protein n=1 Tax=[Clostridium] symbiosum ATCC 14940 TaxID=411472 RepID=A0ABC9TVW8_CLOSY|nr:hypothetical protein CLOSYM_03015 [[Clostridium] symbiosum ATCC 14940]